MLARLLDGGRLDRDEARELMGRVMAGNVPPVQLAALLVSLKTRGETVEEITGFAEAMRTAAVTIDTDGLDVVDTCGTGGDGAHTFNISTATALVVAALDIPVAKHGNRAVSSRCGSADVLEELGVAINLEPGAVAALIRDVGLGFLFAPSLHPAMRHAMPVRRELGVRTVFNVLGPLTNPARARRQLLGVYAPELCEPLARVLGLLGSEHAYVVHGAGGLDEVSPCGETQVAELRDGVVTTFTFVPEEVGVARCTPEALAGGSPAVNAALIREILKGADGPRADAVVLNAGFAAAAAGRAATPREGVALARAALADGRAQEVLARLVQATGQAARRAS